MDALPRIDEVAPEKRASVVSLRRLRRAFWPTYAWLLSWSLVCGVLWCVIDSEGKYSIPFVDPQVRHDLTPHLLTGSIFALLGGSAILGTINLLAFLGRSRARPDTRERELLEYVVRYPAADDIDKVVALGTLLVGDYHIDAATLRRRHAINNEIITCLYETNSDRLLRYFILYPLNADAFRRIVAGDIRNGRGILDKHLCREFGHASAVYMGMVGGVKTHAEGYVMQELLERVRLLIMDPRLKAIFTRGATSDGLRVVKSYGFQKLPPPSEISVLYNNEELPTHPRIRRHFRRMAHSGSTVNFTVSAQIAVLRSSA